MSNTSLVITVSSSRSIADLARFIKDTSEPREECHAIGKLFERIKEGLEPSSGKTSFDVQTSASAPVRASQTLTLTYASISNSDTCVVAGVTLTCVTGTPTAHQFKKQTDATTTAANLVALVNSDATINIYVSAKNVAGVVTFTALAPGKVGNFLSLVGSTGMVAGAATFASGAGGSESIAVNYARG